MTKKKNFLDWVNWVVAFFATIAVGGFFVIGTTRDLVLLSLLPEVIHTVTGWVIIGGAIWKTIADLF